MAILLSWIAKLERCSVHSVPSCYERGTKKIYASLMGSKPAEFSTISGTQRFSSMCFTLDLITATSFSLSTNTEKKINPLSSVLWFFRSVY